MRSFFLAALATLALPACTDDLAGGGGGGGGDDQQGTTCGNGTVDPGEACDDGNANSGDGCSSTCTVEDTSTPRAAVAVGSATVTSDLGVENDIDITLTSMMGFSGSVTLTASMADSTGAAVTDWGVAFDTTTVTLTDGGTATAHIGIKGAGDVAMLAGKVKVTATAGTATTDASIDVTFNPNVKVVYTATADDTKCVLSNEHTTQADPYKIKVGRTLTVFNGAADKGFVVHSDGGQLGFPHEDNTPTAPGNAYPATPKPLVNDSQDKTKPSSVQAFYCHNGVAGTLADNGVRNYLQVVP